jgi:hypothetical protein
LLFASTAFAKSPVASDDPADGSVKPGKTTAAAAATDTDNAAGHPVTPPARAGAATLPTRGGAPRWHSLLPGMIR